MEGGNIVDNNSDKLRTLMEMSVPS